jgi:hypothetical protein
LKNSPVQHALLIFADELFQGYLISHFEGYILVCLSRHHVFFGAPTVEYGSLQRNVIGGKFNYGNLRQGNLVI